MVELFEACKQQASDLERKERVRTQLQQEIQHVYAGERRRQPVSPLSFFSRVLILRLLQWRGFT